MELTVFEILWFFLIFLLIGGYLVLDGFDLGIGVLSPFVSHDEEDRAILRRAIGPVWDGNEVWLLTAGGALFAAFPDAYATTFSGFYLAIMLVLFGLIVRAVSFEFHHGDPHWQPFWNFCFFVGSLLPALLMGVAVGNVIQGIPMDEFGNYIGAPLFGLLTPFTLLTGILGLLMMLTSGACWAALKAPKPSDLQTRVAKLRMPLLIATIIAFVFTTGWGIFMLPYTNVPMEVLRWVFFAVCIIALGLAIAFTRGENDLWTFLFMSLASLCLVGIWACTMFPNLVVASADSIGPNITIFNAASSDLSLICMTVILGIGLPLVLLYHVVIYRTFRGRISMADAHQY